MAKNPYDSRRENELITGCRIPINIYKGENEVRGKIYTEWLNNGVIVRQGMENKCHHHVKEHQTFCKARARSVLMVTPR